MSIVTATEIKARLTGDTPNFSAGWDAVLQDIADQVTAEVDREIGKARGVRGAFSLLSGSTAAERLFSTGPRTRIYLPIDDCTSITSIRLVTRPSGAVRSLVVNTDWIAEATAPIVGVYNVNGGWPADMILGVGVTAKWGMFTTAPLDYKDVILMESIREYLAVRAGNDDRVGSHVFGTVIISKAFSSKTQATIASYGYGGAQAR